MMELVYFLIMAAITIFPMWKVLERVGYAPYWSLLCIIPLGALVLLWFLAFARWPRQDGAA